MSFTPRKRLSGRLNAALRAVPLLALLAVGARAGDVSEQPATTSPRAVPAAPPQAQSPYTPDRFVGRANIYYGTIWGVDSLSVRLVESGQLVRFTYRVVDPARARLLGDKQTEARLDDAKAGVSLVVPTMEKVGPLRQTAALEAGRSYWMTFSNKGRLVVRGDRVDVAIGPFKASNLVVD